MRWIVVLVFSYALLAVEMGVREGLKLGPLSSAPSLVIPFLVFIALHAPGLAVMWTAVLMGLAVDLATRRGPDAAVIVGPHALGYLLAATFILNVRGMMMRRNPWTVVVLSILASVLVSVVVIAIFSLRRVYGEETGASGFDQLLARLLGALMTGASGLLIAVTLFPVAGVFGFADPQMRRPLHGGAARRY